MRYDTFVAAEHYVLSLQATGMVETWYTDGDMMHFKLKSGEEVLTYLIEYPLSVQNILHHLTTNTQKGISTLFIFWADMFLPAHDDLYPLEDWMEALATVQENTLYGFEVAGRNAFFFPVYLDGVGRVRRIRHGELVDFRTLHAYSSEVKHDDALRGRWALAGFGTPTQARPPAPRKATPLAKFYAVLGLPDASTLLAVKVAYRQMAREYHPDRNPDPHAHQRMAQINDAYERLLAYYEGYDAP